MENTNLATIYVTTSSVNVTLNEKYFTLLDSTIGEFKSLGAAENYINNCIVEQHEREKILEEEFMEDIIGCLY